MDSSTLLIFSKNQLLILSISPTIHGFSISLAPAFIGTVYVLLVGVSCALLFLACGGNLDH